jgi:hypothetical protein
MRPELRLPPRLEDWSDHHILIALARWKSNGRPRPPLCWPYVRPELWCGGSTGG